MKYIIMCGGHYTKWEKPRQLLEVKGEPIIARTIRLLRECGVDDIAISTQDKRFEPFGVPILTHENDYCYIKWGAPCFGQWCNAFYPTNEPTCYIFGDVIFSPEAIRTIVDYHTDDIMFFGSKRPFAPEYPKDHVEPFAFKVANTEHLKSACQEVKELDRLGMYKLKPIAWEVWFAVCGADPCENREDMVNEKARAYVAINDYTCDIDYPYEVKQILGHL